MTSPFTAALIDARRRHVRVPLPDGVPEDRAAAFAAQAGTFAGLGLETAGFKVGAQGRSGEPTAAPLAASTVHRDHARVISTADRPLWLEAEVAMIVGRDIPCDHGTPEDEVIGAMEGLAAAIEVVDPRLAEWPEVPPMAALADFSANGATIVSAVGSPALGVAVEDLTVTFEMGPVHVEVRGHNYPGQDMNRLPTWLVNHMAGWGADFADRGLKAGDVIITGSWIGVVPAEAGETATVTIPGIGQVSVEIASE
jgi:2-keto-4-pentenoate hydratase